MEKLRCGNDVLAKNHFYQCFMRGDDASFFHRPDNFFYN